MHSVEIYVDGACSGNPGPAGIGFVLKCNGRKKKIGKFIGQATNNIAEIRAVIEALRALKDPGRTKAVVYTDSQLVEGLINKGWRAKANTVLVASMLEELQKCFKAKVIKVRKGRHPSNVRADQLAREAIKKGCSVQRA